MAINDSMGGPNRLRRAAEPTARRSGTRAALFWVFALVAGLGHRAAARALPRQARRRRTGRRGVGVVVAAVDLPLAAKLKLEDLKVIEWPADHLPPGAISDPKELVGRVLISRVLAQQPLLPGMLAAKNAGSGLAALIPPNMRAIAVRVDDVVGVAGFIHADDRVDVLVTMRADLAGRRVDDQGVPAEHQGAGGRPGGRQRRQEPPARDARHGRDAAGLAAGRGAAGARPDGRADHADVAQLDRLAAGRHRRRQPVGSGRRRPGGAEGPRARTPRAAHQRRSARAARAASDGPPPPPTLAAEAPPQKDTVEILRGDRFEQRNFNRGEKR